MSSIVTALCAVATLFLVQHLRFLPRAVLASIVVVVSMALASQDSMLS